MKVIQTKKVTELATVANLSRKMGRHDAYSATAHRSTLDQIETLREIRDQKEYAALGMSWERFCSDNFGISHRHANRLIQHLNEFGPAYFKLSHFVPLTPEKYRAIQSSIHNDAIEIEGETIPIDENHGVRVVDAVQKLLPPAAAPQTKNTEDPLTALAGEVTAAMEKLEAAADRNRPHVERIRIAGIATLVNDSIARIRRRV